jgi:hypothetical protein
VGIVLIKPVGDELRVVVVFGKNDGLAQSVSVRYFHSPRHEVFQHLVYGVLIEKPSI